MDGVGRVFLKKALRQCDVAMVWPCRERLDVSNSFWAHWIESMITIIWLISSRVVALLMPHLMANISASGEVTLGAVYSKLKTRDLFCHPYATETA